MTQNRPTLNQPAPMPNLSPMQQGLLAAVSFLIVAFGQPAFSWMAGLIASACGYAIFWRILLCYDKPSTRFLLSTGWFTAVQLVQLSWFISHPYIYIYAVYFLISVIIGMQFGVIGIFITLPKISRVRGMLFIAALWTLMEWARLFVFSGLSWNPAGIALTGSLYPLQMASLWGVYGLTFWVMLVNLLALMSWCRKSSWPIWASWAVAAFLPYAYGGAHLWYHDALAEDSNKPHKKFTAVLVQPSFPVEEAMEFADSKSFLAYVFDEWRQILKITKKHAGKEMDLMVMPEFFVPYGTYSFVYPHEFVAKAFKEILGPSSLSALPPLEEPLAYKWETEKGPLWMVNNAYWCQALSNYYKTGLVLGLEDAEDIAGEREYYSAAFYFKPDGSDPQRYEKRVLLPMGEYIPFTFLKQLAAKYGVQGSFTHGKSAKVFDHEKTPFGISICYEETFGHMMRENKQIGAGMLVNLTSDAWYPNSRLPQQHFDHARLRTVENGFPLLRSCNTGITSAIDSLGRIVAVLGEEGQNFEGISDSLLVHVPTYTYQTLYARWGDGLIIGFSLLFLVLGWMAMSKKD